MLKNTFFFFIIHIVQRHYPKHNKARTNIPRACVSYIFMYVFTPVCEWLGLCVCFYYLYDSFIVLNYFGRFKKKYCRYFNIIPVQPNHTLGTPTYKADNVCDWMKNLIKLIPVWRWRSLMTFCWAWPYLGSWARCWGREGERERLTAHNRS